MTISERQQDLLTSIVNLTVADKVHLVIRSGTACAFDLKQLKAKGLVCLRPYRGRFSIYQATVGGCNLVGAPESRSRPLGGQAMARCLAVGHLVCATNYTLISPDEIATVLGSSPPVVPYLLGKDKEDETVFFRVLTPGPYTSPRAVVRSIREIEESRNKSLFNVGEFGYLLVAQSDLRKRALTAAMKTARLFGHDFALRIEIVPPLQEFNSRACAAKNTD